MKAPGVEFGVGEDTVSEEQKSDTLTSSKKLWKPEGNGTSLTVIGGSVTKKRKKGSFQSAGNVLDLSLGGGYMGIQTL